ncbi:hypothetical protein [Phycicoccus duodecadis]|uniref:Uncharacterized protein n=1 Tax=Phycicoccus duodecadis TaxID=173053 RepID=A0A2N3YLA4_9MICO|nr:hypothetical protein [Phycicoccus duodecadis]PKW27636.1 hypothetical protein ATL31_2486 [Phycicoccus duodecadis]
MSDARPRTGQPRNQWLLMQPPVWVPFAWWALLAGSVIASTAGDPGAVCSVEAPRPPDAVFPMVVALMGIAALAFWWQPVAALVAGLGAGILSALFDPSEPGRYAGVVLAVASTGGVAVLRALRARQAQVADAGADGGRSATAAVPATGRRVRRRGWAAVVVPGVGAVGLLLVAGSVVGYQVQTAQEQAHVERAEPTRARVVSPPDDGYQQLFQLEAGPRAGQRVSIEVTDELDRGSERVVLLDPEDPTWSALASEPHGYTFWFGWVVLGVFVAAWAVVQVVARGRAARRTHAPALHRVRIAHGDEAGIVLAGSAQPVGWVRLGSGGDPGSPRGGAVVAGVRGPVADGSWLSIETDSGPLPVVGPLRAAHRWRDLELGAHPRMGAALERAPVVGTVLRLLFFGALGGVLLWFSVGQVGPTWDAAQGRGVQGTFTVTSEDCSGRGPCAHYGDFRSADGRLSFTDVEIVGDSAGVGRSVPALYEGQGEAPDEVFAPGWAALTENAFYLAIGLGCFLEPLQRLVGGFVVRRRPATGRHSRGPTQK